MNKQASLFLIYSLRNIHQRSIDRSPAIRTRGVCAADARTSPRMHAEKTSDGIDVAQLDRLRGAARRDTLSDE